MALDRTSSRREAAPEGPDPRRAPAEPFCGVDLLLAVERGAGSLHRQLEAALREAIRSGRLAPGARLPSSRQVARELGVSRGVAVEAFAQLAAEGWICVRPGASPRVAAAAPRDRPPPQPADAAPPQPRHDLRPGGPDLAGFPREAWLKALRHTLQTLPPHELDYPPLAGVRALRAELASYLARVRGVDAPAAAIQVTGGVGQGLLVLTGALLAAGHTTIAVEDPGHAHIRHLLGAAGFETVGVPVDKQGLDPARIPRNASVLLATPAHQYPTGAVLAAPRRAALLEWLASGDRYLLEDDYDAEYRYDRQPVGALQPLAPDRVAHLGSVSKSLAPALRLGWAVVPPALADGATRAAERLHHGLPAVDQHALAHFIATGGYDRHVRRSRRSYRKRRDVLRALLAEHLPEARVSGAAAGLHVVLEVAPGTDEAALVQAARERGVGVEPMAHHRIESSGSAPALLVGYARTPTPGLAPAVRELAATVHSRSA
jgi:GntR family transcriptional regulator/MocR family aminotransferase